MSRSGDGGYKPELLTRTRGVFKVSHISPYMFWQKISAAETSATSSEAELSPLKSRKMALICWELCRRRHPACEKKKKGKKKCCDWKPGKLMSLHFYLLNLYRLLCQGLWGFSVPSLVIVFPLFAWESDTVLWNLGGGNPSPKLSHMGKTRRPGKSLWIMDIAAVKLRWQRNGRRRGKKKCPVLKGSKGWIFHNCIWAAMRRNKS